MWYPVKSFVVDLLSSYAQILLNFGISLTLTLQVAEQKMPKETNRFGKTLRQRYDFNSETKYAGLQFLNFAETSSQLRAAEVAGGEGREEEEEEGFGEDGELVQMSKTNNKSQQISTIEFSTVKTSAF